MIKFFRKIRQNLLSEGNTGKYLKYAIGEIVLVVIGILIALAINNWNQERLNDKKELDLLVNLKEDLHLNISMMLQLDSVYAAEEEACKKGMGILKDVATVEEFLQADSLISTRWEVFMVNKITYDEMLNNGSFYSLKNKTLQESIRTHFIQANNYVKDFEEINENGQDIAHNNEELFIVELLQDRKGERNSNAKELDTTWISDYNSPIYLTFYKKAKYFTNTNKLRRKMISRFIKSRNDLSAEIEIELEN
ncbi:DUF6090 family protein [Allomuricauda sp. NBRC 101325]|uniref:DUF6090 family protein n=1 Tax=Allomuricauda sp. NBRC 101325 TaxID=1113758 RepID=UPI0024A58B86|nr:DUF6090 family protein [Muricauda sp. NBRC 101325]GLU45218.1 hypothetical protein Musp01_28420 [Muricauda sp. NBRC 101325]